MDVILQAEACYPEVAAGVQLTLEFIKKGGLFKKPDNKEVHPVLSWSAGVLGDGAVGPRWQSCVLSLSFSRPFLELFKPKLSATLHLSHTVLKELFKLTCIHGIFAVFEVLMLVIWMVC